MSEANKALASSFLVKLETKRHMKDWIFNFLGLDFPDTHIDPDSNASPIDWMFETYQMYRNNTANTSPDVIVISARESYKTLSEAAFAIMMMIHFNAKIAHMAAIVPQATAAQKYLESFLLKIQPYLAFHGMQLESQNSKEVSIKAADGSIAYMKIIVCTIAGANSSHTNIFTIDEIDTVRSSEGIRAYKEAQMIPGVFSGQFPVTIKTSTLKFPGGLFSKEMEKAVANNYKIFKWNLLDITEKCPPERNRPDLPKEWRHIAQRSLPLSTLTKEEFQSLTDKEQEKYTLIQANAGCVKCPLLPICQGRLANRSSKDVGGLWKPIDFTISQFKKTDPDLAEAQLMCWKPSSQGMVYPRFLDRTDGTGNTYTLSQAWQRFSGFEMPKNATIQDLANLMHSKGIRFHCGLDWGFKHYFAIVVTAVMPDGEWWIMDTYAVSGLEFDQMMDLAIKTRDKYFTPVKWFCDTAQPMFIKTFRKNKMPAPDFKKDVLGGISAVRSQIVNANDVRKLKVIKHQRNDFMIKMFNEHCFMLDAQGNLTDEPDDSEVADVADALRYAAQNLFAPKGRVISPSGSPTQDIPRYDISDPGQYISWQSQKIRELATYDTSGKDQSGTVFWSFGDPEDGE